MSARTHVPQSEPFRWKDVPVLAYKEDGGTHFRSISRQVLFADDVASGAELRYFEIAPGGHSTLERHDHAHSVMVVRGRGEALVGLEVHPLATHDLVHVPPQTWHQFRATTPEPLGFLCLVSTKRDKPRRPTEAELAELRSHRAAGAFLRV